MAKIPEWVNTIPDGSIFKWASRNGVISPTEYKMQRVRNSNSMREEGWMLTYESLDEPGGEATTFYSMYSFLNSMSRGSVVNGMTLKVWEDLIIPEEDSRNLKLNIDLI